MKMLFIWFVLSLLVVLVYYVIGMRKFWKMDTILTFSSITIVLMIIMTNIIQSELGLRKVEVIEKKEINIFMKKDEEQREKERKLLEKREELMVKKERQKTIEKIRDIQKFKSGNEEVIEFVQIINDKLFEVTYGTKEEEELSNVAGVDITNKYLVHNNRIVAYLYNDGIKNEHYEEIKEKYVNKK